MIKVGMMSSNNINIKLHFKPKLWLTDRRYYVNNVLFVSLYQHSYQTELINNVLVVLIVILYCAHASKQTDKMKVRFAI